MVQLDDEVPEGSPVETGRAEKRASRSEDRHGVCPQHRRASRHGGQKGGGVNRLVGVAIGWRRTACSLGWQRLRLQFCFGKARPDFGMV